MRQISMWIAAALFMVSPLAFAEGKAECSCGKECAASCSKGDHKDCDCDCGCGEGKGCTHAEGKCEHKAEKKAQKAKKS